MILAGLDVTLLIALVLLVPAWKLWRSLRGRNSPEPGRMVRYQRTIALSGFLFLLLTIDWISADRPASDLGLAFPPSTFGMVGLGVAVTFIITMIVILRTRNGRNDPDAEAAEALLPQTPAERRLYVAFALAVGVGWELLYRGFLLWALTPLVGLVGAIIVASLAYGIAHGYKSRRLFIGSLISAFLFVGFYALTSSLWWLMLIHSAMPLVPLAVPARSTEPAN